MLAGDALKNALKVYPAFDDAIAQMPQALRLMRLSQLYDIFVPSRMAEEIYSKLYLAMLRSLQKKERRMQPHKAMKTTGLFAD